MLKKYQPLLLVLLAYIIVGVFYPTITADFVRLDDNVMVLGNDYVKSLSLDNLKNIFTTPYYKLYHPLVTLSFAFEHLFCKQDPFLYHIDNIILHIFNTLLVFFIIKKLSKSFVVPYLTALIFAIHPVHVEVVSWISARKDTLYAFFFLLSILTYMKVDDNKNYKKMFLISVGTFLLSCLSKPTAVTLPLFLMLIDFCNGKMSFGRFKRYIPYVLISAIFIYVTITCHYYSDEKVIFTFFFKYVNFISAHLNIMFYGYKFIFPLNLSCLYPYFFSDNSMMPWYVLYSPVLLYTIMLFVLLSLEHTRKIFFGFFFFFFALLPSSGIMPTGVAPVADRYAYLAIIGLAYLMVELFLYLSRKTKYLKVLIVIFFVCILSSWAYLTYHRNITWRNSIQLMTEAINYSPDKASHAYLTRGIIYKGFGDLEAAESDFEKSYNINKRNVAIFFHLGHLKQLQKKYDEALKYYAKVPENYYDYAVMVNNVGLILGEQNKNKKAIDFLEKQIDKIGKDSSFVEYLYANLAALYLKEKNYDESLKYIQLACNKNPTNYAYYIMQMIVYNEKDDFANFENIALEGLKKTDDNVNIMNELASKYFMMGRYDDVENLLSKERKLNSDNSFGYFLLGNIAAIKTHFKLALIYYTMAIETSNDKKNSEYYLNRAAVYLLLGDYEKAKLNADIAKKKGHVIGDDFKEDMEILKQQVTENENRLKEEKKLADKFAAIKEFHLKAKKAQEKIVMADIAAVKNMEMRKAEQENIIYASISIYKNRESTRKQIQEEAIALSLQMKKHLSDKEKEAKRECESRMLAFLNIFKAKEALRKQIEEQNTFDRLKALKNNELRKAKQENIISKKIRINAIKDLDIVEYFDIDGQDDEDFERYDEDSAFNI